MFLQSNTVIYEKLNKESNKYEWSDFSYELVPYSWKDIVYGDATKYFELTYSKEKNFYNGKVSPTKNLKINLLNSDKTWYYGHPEVRNFGGVNYSLDDFKGNLKLDKGMYSTDGFVSIEDNDTDLINEFKL